MSTSHGRRDGEVMLPTTVWRVSMVESVSGAPTIRCYSSAMNASYRARCMILLEGKTCFVGRRCISILKASVKLVTVG